MSRKVDVTRNDALHMEVIPWEPRDRREVYELIRDGWHPSDVAKAYGFLVRGRCLVRLLDSPLWSNNSGRQFKKRATKMFARQPIVGSHDKHWRYSQQDKDDALWLADNGWWIYDIAVMLDMTIGRSKGKIHTTLYTRITKWAQERRDNNI